MPNQNRCRVMRASLVTIAVGVSIMCTEHASAAQPTVAQVRAYDACMNPCIDRVPPDCMAQRGERTFVYRDCYNRGINECRKSCRSHLEQ
jgi:hypothetical protein